jgi:hypothetical protein
MSMQATGTFKIDSWVDTPIEEWADGAKLGRARVTKTFQGEIAGESVAELLLVGAGEGSRAYVGFERITARVRGRAGSFLLHHSATMSRGGASATWTIVPDSGTGELTGLRGAAKIDRDASGGHAFTLDYDLDGPASAPQSPT